MNKVCSGLVWTSDALIARATDEKATDPDGLKISSDDDVTDYAAMKALQEKDQKDIVWEDYIAVCRGWYDANKWEKAFCCQTGKLDGEWQEGEVYSSSKTVDAETLTVGGMEFQPYAEAFKAATRLGGVAALLSAAIFMN